MISAIILSPCHFFDTTPSGILVNRFSNDLGIIDSTLIIGFIDTIEGPIIVLIAFVNLCQINLFMIILVVIVTIVGILFFFYSRPAICKCKELELQAKSPIFSFCSESIAGLIQIRINNQRGNKMQSFSQIVNKSTKTDINFHLVSKAFGFY